MVSTSPTELEAHLDDLAFEVVQQQLDKTVAFPAVIAARKNLHTLITAHPWVKTDQMWYKWIAGAMDEVIGFLPGRANVDQTRPSAPGCARVAITEYSYGYEAHAPVPSPAFSKARIYITSM